MTVGPEAEPTCPPDPDVESAWLEEVRRRGMEIDTGQVEVIPADEVFRKLKAAAAINHPH
jgi:hypothetical protein